MSSILVGTTFAPIHVNGMGKIVETLQVKSEGFFVDRPVPYLPNETLSLVFPTKLNHLRSEEPLFNTIAQGEG